MGSVWWRRGPGRVEGGAGGRRRMVKEEARPTAMGGQEGAVHCGLWAQPQRAEGERER